MSERSVEELSSALTPRHHGAFVKQLRPCCQPFFFTVPGVTPIEETAGRVLTPMLGECEGLPESGLDIYRVAQKSILTTDPRIVADKSDKTK